MSNNALQLVMKKLGSWSGVNRLHAHLLRNTFAVKYLANGGANRDCLGAGSSSILCVPTAGPTLVTCSRDPALKTSCTHYDCIVIEGIQPAVLELLSVCRGMGRKETRGIFAFHDVDC